MARINVICAGVISSVGPLHEDEVAPPDDAKKNKG
jgi:hypothetical protein